MNKQFYLDSNKYELTLVDNQNSPITPPILLILCDKNSRCIVSFKHLPPNHTLSDIDLSNVLWIDDDQ